MGAEIVAAAPPPLSLKCRWGSVADNPSAKFGLIRHLIRLITANWCQFHRSSFISLAVEKVSPSIWSSLGWSDSQTHLLLQKVRRRAWLWTKKICNHDDDHHDNVHDDVKICCWLFLLLIDSPGKQRDRLISAAFLIVVIVLININTITIIICISPKWFTIIIHIYADSDSSERVESTWTLLKFTIADFARELFTLRFFFRFSLNPAIKSLTITSMQLSGLFVMMMMMTMMLKNTAMTSRAVDQKQSGAAEARWDPWLMSAPPFTLKSSKVQLCVCNGNVQLYAMLSTLCNTLYNSILKLMCTTSLCALQLRVH